MPSAGALAQRIHSVNHGLTPPRTTLIFFFLGAGWSSLVARRAHNPEVAGSNPAPAIRIVRAFARTGNLESPCRLVTRSHELARSPALRAPAPTWTLGRAAREEVDAFRVHPMFLPPAPPQQRGFLFAGQPARCGQVAQLVEHMTENHGVGSSILPLATAGRP